MWLCDSLFLAGTYFLSIQQSKVQKRSSKFFPAVGQRKSDRYPIGHPEKFFLQFFVASRKNIFSWRLKSVWKVLLFFLHKTRWYFHPFVDGFLKKPLLLVVFLKQVCSVKQLVQLAVLLKMAKTVVKIKRFQTKS